MTPLAPSEVRQRILSEHGALRTRLEELEGLLQRIEVEPAAANELGPLFSALTDAFLQHISEEEHLLRPLLADVDAWGAQRVEAMDEEHAAQRARLARLRELGSHALAAEARDFVKDLRADMASEEKDCLNPNLIRDDTVTIDYFGG